VARADIAAGKRAVFALVSGGTVLSHPGFDGDFGVDHRLRGTQDGSPAFLAKTTDGSSYPEVTAILRFHSFKLFGALPAGWPAPSEPEGYEDLRWAPHPEAVPNLEEVLRERLRRSKRSRTAVACREIGWLFGDWAPDSAV
jgi:hypothetical protein